jgi:hypothetical protein
MTSGRRFPTEHPGLERGARMRDQVRRARVSSAFRIGKDRVECDFAIAA